jgi:hypothetical protein
VEGEVLMPSRRCNIRILEETGQTYRGVRDSIPHQTSTAISRSLRAAQAAAQRGNCAEMHRYTQAARATMEKRLDALLGRR